MPKRTDREGDYMCFSPLRRKKSELEGEEEYCRLVSRNLCDWRQNVINKGCVPRKNSEEIKKTVNKLNNFFTVLKNDEKK
jgi:hypothetical protein